MRPHFLALAAAFFALISPSLAQAKFYAQYSLGHNSDEDNVTGSTFSYSRMNNLLFAGANLDEKQKWIIGWNFYLWSRDYQANGGTTNKISLTELGPRVQFFFNDERNFYSAVAYHPYVKGKLNNGTDAEVSGSGYIISIGYHHRASKTVFFGASLNYQSTSLSKSTVSNTESDVNYSYTNIIPMIEMSMRFK